MITMNLIIDIGNTQTKYALFKKNVMIEFRTSYDNDLDLISSWREKYPETDSVIVSSVQLKPESFLDSLKMMFARLIYFDQNTPTPLKNLYESKATLGYDRLAACVGAYVLYPNSNLLVIDAGTAITFDFVDAKNQYLGGAISPGLSMRFKALNEFTKKLPLLEKSDSCQLIGKNTSQAIISGVQNGLLFEMDTYINQIKEKHDNAKFFLTGGDADFLSGKLQNRIETNKQLLLMGLNSILNYNCS